MQRCLNKEQIRQLFDLEIENFDLNNDPSDFENLVFECINWEKEIICLTYFLSQIFELKIKQGVAPKVLIHSLQDFFDLQNRIWLSFQEFDDGFIDYLYRHTKDETLSLEESLIRIQDWLSEYRYV